MKKMNKSKIINRITLKKFTLIAEIGVNYYDVAKKLNISLIDAAKFMILEAKNAGIHAVKFQSYKADTLASKYSPAYWDLSEEETTSQYELFKKFDSFEERDYIELSKFCNKIGIEFCSTPFDFYSADYLEHIMDVYKISSSDLSNIPFIEYIAQKKKPIILSVGASNLEEIDLAVETIRKYNNEELVLMHCVLEYPTPYPHANLLKIKGLAGKFTNIYIGYSDHTKPDASFDVIKTAYLLGATVIEKHFTADKMLPGNDHYHAMDAHDAAKIIDSINFIDTILGSGDIKCLESEAIARENARRSLVAQVDIPKGTIIKREMLTFKRPGHGISPQNIDEVIGKSAKEKIYRDEVLKWSIIE